jgi:hypothetical protein
MPCPKCKRATAVSKTYDAAYCSACNLWLEGRCSDPQCQYCSKRPAKPPKTAAPAAASARTVRDKR